MLLKIRIVGLLFITQAYMGFQWLFNFSCRLMRTQMQEIKYFFFYYFHFTLLIFITSQKKSTPLHLASQYGLLKTTRALLWKRADPNVQDKVFFFFLLFYLNTNLGIEKVNTSSFSKPKWAHLGCPFLVRLWRKTVRKRFGKKILPFSIQIIFHPYFQNRLSPLEYACQNGYHKIAYLFINDYEVNSINESLSIKFCVLTRLTGTWLDTTYFCQPLWKS